MQLDYRCGSLHGLRHVVSAFRYSRFFARAFRAHFQVSFKLRIDLYEPVQGILLDKRIIDFAGQIL